MGVGKRNRDADRARLGLVYSEAQEEAERLRVPTLLYTELIWDDHGDIYEEDVYTDGTRVKVVK